MDFLFSTLNIYLHKIFYTLFQKFKIDKVNETLLIKVSEEFEYILNSIGTNFTRFELENMTNLKSSYVKELYRQLMAHKNRRSKKVTGL